MSTKGIFVHAKGYSPEYSFRVLAFMRIALRMLSSKFIVLGFSYAVYTALL